MKGRNGKGNSSQDTVVALSAFPAFAALPKRSLEALAQAGKVVRHLTGDGVIAEGGTPVGVHVILDGHAEVVKQGEVVAKLGAGEIFGEIGAIDGKVRTASVIATTELETLSIPDWNLRPLMDARPEISRLLLDHMVSRLRNS